MSAIVFERAEQRIRIEYQPPNYRILTGGSGPAGLNGNVVSPDGSVPYIVALTQAEYDALPSKDPNTIYHIYTPED